ncbi:amino acid adenylation domain-containing protein [Micromonospora sp. WMMA1363]|uniref:non-ribosomal peptide synthetase n=1 Tax=Micromonospora sp. WMMA1363 TaxID=3053985 RepID=UPI00259CA006|nr:non-ribosomal peptide synthetase [Micromonospora sp. WMMA1363]MDM4719726.1 amino acid adenylation domain-containing protein [Micromonospora sp. WMMA1363]
MNRTAVETRLLARVRERRGSASIPRRDRSAATRLSFAQLRLWLLDRLVPLSSEYVIPCAFRVRGELDVAALESAFRSLVQRHEVLRTRFDVVDEEPVQVIDADPRVRVSVVHVSGESDADERERIALAAVERDAALGFDLAVDQPLRVTVVRLAEDDHLLLVAVHHIAADGWSMEVLTRELREFYDAALTGRPAALADLPVQYADYAAWQRDWLTRDILERQLGYWRERLADMEPLELPTDRPRPLDRSGAGGSLEFRVPATVAHRLAGIATGQGASLFMAALAAFQIVLSRWSGQDDVVVGSPVAGRSRAESEDLIGFFVNTLVLRTDTSGDPTFEELLRRVRETALGAYTHQDLPFERLVEELAPERDLSRNPLFQLSFVFQNFQESRWTLPGVTVEPVNIEATTSKFDVLLALAERSDGGLDGELTFSTELFEETTAHRLTAHYLRVLDQVTADPGQRIGQVDLLTAAERSQIVADWNNTAIPYPDVTIHELVATQAARTPDATAVVFRDQRLTYAQLDDRANHVAVRLNERGVTRGARVGVCAERSLELVIALLGVLKAGAAFVPLDPEYPTERLQFMLTDAEVRVVLTHTPVRERVPAGADAVINLDELEVMPPLERTAFPADPDDVAYVMYTSGSTGTPKGVPNTHRGVVNRLLWGQETFRLAPSDRVLQKTPYSFDVAIWEFFWPLLAGARLVMAEPGGHRDPKYLRSVLLTERITTVHFIPSMLREFLNAVDLTECTELRQVFCSGEALPTELARRFLEAKPSCSLHNLYGPTEASIEVSHWTCRPDDPGPVVPIGRPIANIELLIVDKAGQLAPIGVPGELWIGGVGVALGYLNRPELTAERFIRHPFSRDPSARMYRTGDLVRWLTNGAIEYIGRIDRQVKVRGLRIELGEIESVLTRHESVASSVVVVREDEPGDQRLVAYCVPTPGRRLDPVALRQWCRRSLPGYMTPGWIISLDDVPRTQSGKVNHRALPKPANDRQDLDQEYTAPRTEVEKLIAGVWADILGQDRIGVHDNFFDLGGHSLLGARFVSRVSEELGVDVPLRTLFTAPTVAQLGAYLALAGGPDGAADRDHHLAPLLSLSNRGDRTPLFCIHPAMGLGWSFTALLPHLTGRPIHTLQAPALTGEDQLPESIEGIAAQYVRRIRSIQPHGPYLLLGRSFGGLAAYEMAAQLERAGEQVALLALLDSLPAAPEPVPDPGQTQAIEQDSLRILWRNGRPGEPVPASTTTLDRAQTVAAVRTSDGPMHGWSEPMVSRLVDVCARHIELSVAYKPKEYQGRLHFFSATADPGSLSSAAKAAVWGRFAPDVVVHEIDCRHSEVLTPGPAATIAAELSRLLDEHEL